MEHIVDIIDDRRIKLHLSKNNFCATSGITKVMYEKYLKGEKQPPLKVIDKMLDAVGLKAAFLDGSIRNRAFIRKWQQVVLYIHYHKSYVTALWRKNNGLYDPHDGIVFHSAKTVLFYSWWHRYNKAIPNDAELIENISTNIDIQYILAKLQQNNYFTETGELSLKGHKFYELIEKKYNEFLRFGNMLKEV